MFSLLHSVEPWKYPILFGDSLEGWEVEKRILNIEYERVRMFVDIDSVNPAAKYLTLFFMIKITYYTPLINIEVGATWLPFWEN